MAVSKTGPAGVLVPDRDLAGDEDVLPGEVVLSTVQYSTVQYSTVQYSTVQYSAVLDEDVLPGEVVLRQQHCQGPGQGLVVVVGHCCVYVSVTCRQCCIHNFKDVLMNGSYLSSKIIKTV